MEALGLLQIDVQVPVPFHLYLGAVDAFCVEYTKVMLYMVYELQTWSLIQSSKEGNSLRQI